MSLQRRVGRNGSYPDLTSDVASKATLWLKCLQSNRDETNVQSSSFMFEYYYVLHVGTRFFSPLLAQNHSIQSRHPLTVLLDASTTACNLEERDCAGGRALHSAACGKQDKIFKTLPKDVAWPGLRCGFPCLGKDPPLWKAVWTGKDEAVRSLAERKADQQTR